MILSEVPPTPVIQALVAGQDPDATPFGADRSPSSPELKSTVMPCAAPAMAAWSYMACDPGAIDSPLLPQLSVTTSATWLYTVLKKAISREVLQSREPTKTMFCLLYTSDAADDLL